jgi:hypothetical protein
VADSTIETNFFFFAKVASIYFALFAMVQVLFGGVNEVISEAFCAFVGRFDMAL